MTKMISKLNYALELLSPAVYESIRRLASDDIDEIRLRINRPPALSIGSRDMFVDGAAVTREDIDHTFKAAFSYSLHSYSKELSEGYVTTRGGNRVGLCGTAVMASKEMETVKNISSINIRIAKEVKNCADEIAARCFNHGAEGILVIGPPGSGKTTILRDIARQLGNRLKISLIDERGEIAAEYRGAPQNDVGAMTDVFSGYPKHIGVAIAVRVMSPKAVIVDEIGAEDEVEALEYALHSGVSLITAVHGIGYEDARTKPAVKRLLQEKAFSYAVELHKRKPEVIKIA